MEYLKGTKIICLKYSEVVPLLFSAGNFRLLAHRGKLVVHGRNGVDSEKLVEFGSLRRADKDKVVEQFGDPRAYIQSQPMLDMLRVDVEAQHFYARYTYKNGQTVDLKKQMLWMRSVQWLNVIKSLMGNKQSAKAIMGLTIAELWENVAMLVKNDEVEHDLPGSVDRLQRVYRGYVAEGYAALVDEWRMGNDYARKVNPKIENLIISLYVMQGHQAYMNEVCRQYRKFMNGELQVVNVHPETGGEVFDPKDFYVPGTKEQGGKDVMVPYALGESTVDYYLKKEGNQVVINKIRLKGQDYGTLYRPSVKRLSPEWALSKVTMDDIDLPFKGPDGDRVVKSYQAYDVCSEAIIGVAFSEDKNKELILECMRDMARLIIRNNWGMPFELEMERHLTSAMMGKMDKETGEWTDDIFTQGVVFPSLRICQSAQAKRAEGFIRKKKYGFQRKREGFQGRFYAKLLTNRLNTDQKQLRFAFEQIVNNELADIAAYNNELHPKQDKYPGLSRWQVLEQYQNQSLPKFPIQSAIKYIGYQTATSIRAGVARVQYGDYQLPDINLIQQTHYNGEIVAYYLPDDDGQVASVHLFEDGQYLCEARRKEGFQEAVVEQTAADVAIMQQQWGQQSAFDKMVRDGRNKLVPVGVTTNAGSTANVVKRKGVVKQIAAPAAERLPGAMPGDARSRALQDI